MEKSNERRVVEYARRNPGYHIEKIQGASLEIYQQGVCRAFAGEDNIVVTACHGVGKTFIAGKIVLAFAPSWSKSKTITTAPTQRQVRDLLWSEIRSGYAQSRHFLGGEMLQTKWNLDNEGDWFAVGVTSKPTKGQEQGSNLQGYHAESMLLVFDEAQGIDADKWDQADGMKTSSNVKHFCIGNPLSKDTKFYEATNSRFWHHISLTCFDSPNMIENGLTDKRKLIDAIDKLRGLPDHEVKQALDSFVVVRPHLLTAKAVLAKAYELGVDNPIFQARFLGEFPEKNDSNLITASAVEAAMAREPAEGYQHAWMGVDVARQGSDKTVITIMRDLEVLEPIRLIGKTNTEVAGRIMQEIEKEPKLLSITIDGTGVGAGVVDILRENREQRRLREDLIIYEVHFGEGCRDEEDRQRFSNLKAKMFYDLADDLQKLISLPDMNAYVQQLPTIRYKLDSKGRVVMESKQDYKKRTGRGSPDEADSLALVNLGRRESQQRDPAPSFDLDSLDLGKSSTWKG